MAAPQPSTSSLSRKDKQKAEKKKLSEEDRKKLLPVSSDEDDVDNESEDEDLAKSRPTSMQTAIIMRYLYEHEISNGQTTKYMDQTNLIKICHLTGMPRSQVLNARTHLLKKQSRILHAAGMTASTTIKGSGETKRRELRKFYKNAATVESVTFTKEERIAAHAYSTRYLGKLPHQRCLYEDKDGVVQVGGKEIINANRHDLHATYWCEFKKTSEDNVIEMSPVQAIIGQFKYRNDKSLETQMEYYTSLNSKEGSDRRRAKPNTLKSEAKTSRSLGKKQTESNVVCRAQFDLRDLGFTLDTENVEVLLLVVGENLAEIMKDSQREALLAAYTENSRKMATLSTDAELLINNMRTKKLVQLHYYHLQLTEYFQEHYGTIFSFILKSNKVQPRLFLSALSFKEIFDRLLHFSFNITREDMEIFLDNLEIESILLRKQENNVKLYAKL